MRSTRGFTVVEILAATSILILVLSIATAALRSAQRTQAETQSVVSLTGDVLAGVRQIRKDLENTNLGSVAVFKEPPSCSMGMVDDKKPVTDFGTPNWNGHIYYTLEKTENKVAKLLRWTLPQDKPDGYPSTGKLSPWNIPQRANPSIAIKNLLSPAWSVKQGTAEFGLVKEPGAGGFQVRFVRRTGEGRELSLENPNKYEDSRRSDWTAGNTTLVRVDLVVVRQDRARLSAVKFDLRVMPQN